MRKLISVIIFLSTCLFSTAQSTPVDFESVFRPNEIYSNLSYLPQQRNPYDIKGIGIKGSDWKTAANYEFGKFQQLEFVYVECNPDELPAILEKLADLPALRKLIIAEVLLSWEPGIIGDSLPFPENIRKLKSLKAIQFESLRSYKWSSIAQQLIHLPLLQHLSIRGQYTDYIDSGFQGLDQLISFQINGGLFMRLPEWFENFHELEFLDISGNQKLDYEDAFKTLGKLPSLRILKINGVRLESFPTAFGNLNKLEKLYANYFYTKNFDAFFQICSRLKNLKYLELDHGDSLSLPPSIGLLSALEYLSLNDRKLAGIPAEIGNLRNLKYLSLYNNKISFIPPSILNLKNLETFRLINNRLVSLPPEIGSLSSLRNLELGANKLQSIPSTIGNLSQLESLDFNNNKVDSLPSSITICKNLISLSFGVNKVRELPSAIGNLNKLETLSATGNQISCLPVSIGELSSLKNLHLDFNAITTLPKSFCSLGNLQLLSLNNNSLTGLPEEFGNLIRLQELNITSGTLSRFNSRQLEPDSNYNSNKLKGIPASFVKLDSLKTLRLTNSIVENGNQVLGLLLKLKGPVERTQMENCAITELPSKGWDKSQIQYLELNRNAISNFPVNILEAPLLQFIDLTENRMQPPFNRSWNSKIALLLTAIDEKLAGYEVIKTYDSLTCQNILEAANYFYSYDNFEKLLGYYELAARNCKDIKSSAWWSKNMYGVSLYHTGKYKEAIPYLEDYIKKMDAIRGARLGVINIRPVFEALAKSHLALNDTSVAIEIYKKWTARFSDRSAAIELALLWIHKKDRVAADAWFERAIVSDNREFIQPRFPALTQLEILVMQNKTDLVYEFLLMTDTTKYSKQELMLLEYLLVSHEVSNNNMPEEESMGFIQMINAMDESRLAWNYTFFRSWIKTFADKPAIMSRLILLTDTMEKKFHQ